MTTIHFGVLVVPYKDEKGKPELTTTGEVATKLEYRYNVMQVFFDKYQNEISEIVMFEMLAVFENVALGMPIENAYMINLSKVDTLFNQYLDKDEWQTITGRTIKAAQAGHSKRFKDRFNEKGLRGPRPAFIDSGLYEDSFKAWIEEKMGAL